MMTWKDDDHEIWILVSLSLSLSLEFVLVVNKLSWSLGDVFLYF